MSGTRIRGRVVRLSTVPSFRWCVPSGEYIALLGPDRQPALVNRRDQLAKRRLDRGQPDRTIREHEFS